MVDDPIIQDLLEQEYKRLLKPLIGTKPDVAAIERELQKFAEGLKGRGLVSRAKVEDVAIDGLGRVTFKLSGLNVDPAMHEALQPPFVAYKDRQGVVHWTGMPSPFDAEHRMTRVRCCDMEMVDSIDWRPGVPVITCMQCLAWEMRR